MGRKGFNQVQVEGDLYEEYASRAQQCGVSVTWFINKVLKETLPRLKDFDSFVLTRDG